MLEWSVIRCQTRSASPEEIDCDDPNDSDHDDYVDLS
jgi:hypothetical protein